MVSRYHELDKFGYLIFKQRKRKCSLQHQTNIQDYSMTRHVRHEDSASSKIITSFTDDTTAAAFVGRFPL